MEERLEVPPHPVAQVKYTIFEDGEEWEAVVSFYDAPEDLLRESLEMAIEVVQQSKYDEDA